MADELITKQELIDAKPDVKNLGEAANGNETGIVTPRYGAPYSTAPAAIQKIQTDGTNAIQSFQTSADSMLDAFQTESATAIQKFENTGGFISAPTLTALQAIVPTYDYQLARVDETGDEYRWNPALTTTVKWEPTGRNYIQDSKVYTDNEVAAALTTASNDASTKAENAKSEIREEIESNLSKAYPGSDIFQFSDSNFNKVLAIGPSGELKPTSLLSTQSFTANESTLKYYNKDIAYQYCSKDGRLLFTIFTDGTTSVDTNVDEKISTALANAIDLNPRFNLHRLREYRRKRQQLKRTNNTVLRLGCFGDSWTDNRLNWISEVSEELKSGYGNGGCWFGFGSLNNATSDSISGTCTIGEGWSNIDFTVPSPHLRATTTSTNGSIITINTALVGSAKLCAKGVSGSSIRYKWGDGAYTTVDLSTTNATIWTDLGSVSGALTIESVGGAPVLYGVYVETEKGIVLNKFAAASTKVSQWNAVDETQFKAAIAEFNLDVAIILFGTNDVYSYGGEAYVTTYLPVLISRIKAVAPNADILLITPPINLATNIPTTGDGSLAGYATAVRKFSKENNYAHLSLQEFFGLTNAEYGDSGTQYFTTADLVHPATNGKAVLAETILQTLELN